MSYGFLLTHVVSRPLESCLFSHVVYHEFVKKTLSNMLDERSVFTVAELGPGRKREMLAHIVIVPSDLRLTDDSRADSCKGVNLIDGDHRVIKHVASTAGSTELGKRRQAELGNATAAMQARCGHDQRQRMIQQHVY